MQIRAGVIRQVLSAVVGIAMIYYFTGVKVIYSIVAVIIAVLIHLFASYRYLLFFFF